MSGSTSLRIALGGDHAGFPLKQAVAQRLTGIVTTLTDCGTNSAESCDYPDFAIAVAKEVIQGRADRGIVVCGSGVGVSVAANKIPGIRAAVCHDTYSAHQGVEHDDMNVLCIGGRIIGSELAFEIIDAFLQARYVPQDRHARRLTKVLDIEKLGLGVLIEGNDGRSLRQHSSCEIRLKSRDFLSLEGSPFWKPDLRKPSFQWSRKFRIGEAHRF